MKNRIIILVIMIMAIGFASVSTILYINGEVAISSNNEDFDVYFSQLDINGETNNKFIVSDKAIYFNSKFSSVGDKDTLKYYITNGSKNYDANVSINCTSSDDYLRINNSWINEDIISARETKTGELSVELLKVTDEVINIPVQCTISVDAIEKTSTVNSDVPDKVEKLFELVDDKNNNMFADIGDEIAIGNEHFYIISNDDDEYKAIAKYNLYVGEILDVLYYDEPIYDIYEAIEKNEKMGLYDFRMQFSTCGSSDEFDDKLCKMIDEPDDEHDTVIKGIYILTSIDSNLQNYNLQHPLALGAHGGSYGNPEFPQYGIFWNGSFYRATLEETYKGFTDYDITQYIIGYDDENETYITYGNYFDNYMSYLRDKNRFVKRVYNLSLKDLNDLYNNIYNSDLPLGEWGANIGYLEKGLSTALINDVADLKEYFSNDYSFLWNTTYWLKTSISSDIHLVDDIGMSNTSLFVDTLGHVCNGNFCENFVGAGIRPVITIGY